MSLVTYRREGGGAPLLKESLTIGEDGAWAMERVVSSQRAGRFAGHVNAEQMAALRKAIAAAKGTEASAESGRPPQVREYITTDEASVTFVSGQRLPSKLARLADLLRELSEDLKSEPVAALDLAIAADARTVTLAALGSDALELDMAKATLTFDLFGEKEDYLTSGAADLEELPGTGPLEPGWTKTVTLPGEFEFNPKRTLQLRFTFRMKSEDGIWRDAQVTAVAGKGWF